MSNVLTQYMGGKAHQLLFLAWLLSVVKKDSFESSDTGLFTSNSVDKSDVCAIPFAGKNRSTAAELWKTWTA